MLMDVPGLPDDSVVDECKNTGLAVSFPTAVQAEHSQRRCRVCALDHEYHRHPGLCTSQVSVPQAVAELTAQGFLQPGIAIAPSLGCDSCECDSVFKFCVL